MVGRRLISGRQALGVEFDMRNALYAQLLRLSFGFYDRHQTGQLMSRATVDLQAVRFFLGYGLIFFFQHVLTVVGVTDRALRRRLAARADRARDHAGARRRSPTATATSRTRSSATCSRSWPTSRRSPRRTSSASTSSSRSRRSEPSRRSSTRAPRPSSSRRVRREPAARALRAAALVPAAARAGGRAARRRPDGRRTASSRLGDFVAFNLYLAHARHAAAHARHVDRPGAARDRVGRADLRGDRRARGDRRRGRARSSCRPGAGRVRFEDVSLRVRRRAARCCEDIDLELEPGRTVALIGHTGSGKTTLAVARPALLRRHRRAACSSTASTCAT